MIAAEAVSACRDGDAPTHGSTLRLAPVTGWRIHIGAHKTATTHLQATLAAMRPTLVEQGVDFIPNDRLKESGLTWALRRKKPWHWLPPLRGPMMRGTMALLDPVRAGPARLVLSKEDLIGRPRHIFADPIYPDIHRIAALLGTLGRQADVTLFLSIRSFDKQLPSAYVQELKFMPPIAGGFENLKRQVIRRPPSWFDLVSRIRAAAPGIPLRIWRQEDYRSNTAAVLSELTGLGDLGPLPRIEDRNTSPSYAAIRAVEALPPAPEPERRKRAREIIRTDGRDGPRFQPFSEDERAVLRAAYAADLERIAALDPKMLIRF